MSEPPSVPLAPPPGATALHRPFSRRSLLMAALAGTALAATGCTSSTADDPDATLLAFLQSTYEAAAVRAGWDRAALERAG